MTETDQRRKDEDDDDKEFGAPAQVTVFLVVIVVVLIIGLLPHFLYWLSSRPWPESAALFGDSFGFANAMVSACAFAAVIITLRMQRKELKLQRAELEATREELKKSAEAQARSEKRLAAAAALDGLQSLREVAASRSLPIGSFGELERDVLLGRVETAIAATLQSLEIDTIRPSPVSLQALAEEGMALINMSLGFEENLATQEAFAANVRGMIGNWGTRVPHVLYDELVHDVVDKLNRFDLVCEEAAADQGEVAKRVAEQVSKKEAKEIELALLRAVEKCLRHSRHSRTILAAMS